MSLVVVLFLIPSISSAYFESSLKYGSKGNAVSDLQDFLIDQGYLVGVADGKFGLKTFRSVRAFQSANDLSVDGYFGKASRTKAELILEDELKYSDAAEQIETGSISSPFVETTPLPVIIQNSGQSIINNVEKISMKDIVISDLTDGNVVPGKHFDLKVSILGDAGNVISDAYPIVMVSSELPNQKNMIGGGGDKNIVQYYPQSLGDFTLTFSYDRLGLSKEIKLTSKE